MFASEKERKFFYDWYFRAHLDENFDADRQFFYYYAIFDHLTKSHGQEQKEELTKQGLQITGGERGLVKYFLHSVLYTGSDADLFKTYNPLATLKSGKQMRLIEKLQTKQLAVPTKIFELPPFEVISALFMEIYDVRCNLFHGEADLSDFENNKLIDEANIVLKGFFDRLFGSNLLNGKK